MTTQTLLILLAGVALGVLLLVLGIRGKRLNRHPVCRDCRFDLSGQPEGTITCPECGAGLKRPRAVRIGQRRKRPVFIALGGVLTSFPLLLIAAAAWALLTGAEIDQYKPLGLLLWEAKHTGATRMTSIARELNRRVTGKKLSPSQRGSVVETALWIQGEPAKPWCSEWGDLIEDAKADGTLSKEDDERYRRNAPVLEWTVRPRVMAGDPVPVVAKVKEARVGSAAMMQGMASMTSATVDGTKVKPAPAVNRSGMYGFFSDPGMQQFIQLAGPKNPWGFGNTVSELPIALALPRDTAPGSHRCEVTYRIKIMNMSTGTIHWPDLKGEKSGDTGDHAGTVTFQSLPKGTESVDVVAPTEATSGKLREILEPRIQLWGSPPGAGFPSPTMVMMQFSVDGLPMDVAYDVSIKSGDRSWNVGTFTSGTAGDMEHVRFGPGMDKQRSVQGNVPGIGKAKTVTVVLTPSADTAKRTTDVTRIYGGELVFDNVAVAREDRFGVISSGSGGDDETEKTDPTEKTDKDTKKADTSALLKMIFGK